MRRFSGSIFSRAVSGVVVFAFLASTVFAPFFATPLAFASPATLASDGNGASSSQVPAQPAPVTVVRELTDKRTETSESYLMSDGTIQAHLHSGPVRFKDASGDWTDIDNTLVPGMTPGDIVPAASPIGERFGEIGGASPQAQISTGKWSVGMDLIGAVDNGKTAIGDTVHYPGVAADTELDYQASPSGMKDTLVLSSAQAPTQFRFFMTLSKLQAQLIPGAGMGLFGSNSSRPSLTLGKLRVFDSSDPASGAAVCADAQMTVVPAPGGAIITYTIPQAWLSSSDRVFPVRIDPSVNLSAQSDTYINSIGNLSTNEYDHEMFSGYDATDGECYSLIYFDTTPIAGAIVDSATLSLTSWDGTAGAGEVLARNTQYWPDSIIYSDGVPSSSFLASATLNSSWVMNFNVTNTVQDFCSGKGPDQGFQLYSPSPGNPSTWIGWATSEANELSDRPVLTVSYSAPHGTNATGTATGLSWYTGGGPDNQATLGRGQVSLSWPAVSRATGYKILAFDGSAYRQVGDVIGTATTNWTSAGCNLYPSDSTIASMPAGNTSNAFVQATTPGAGSTVPSRTVTDSSLPAAGIVLSDGAYLYVLRYYFTGGATTWHRVGSGFGGTTAGHDYGTVGPSLSSYWSRSAFLMAGDLWNGRTMQPAQLQGYSMNATSGTSPDYWTFSKPFIDYYSGADGTGNSGSILVAADAQQIYSAATSMHDGGGDYDGFRVRVYDKNGNWIADHNIPMRSYDIDGFVSDGSSLYFIGATGDDSALVTKVRLSDFAVINQFSLNESNESGPGCFDATNNCFWLGQEWDVANIYCYQGPGFDLRDDPRQLYSTMSSAATNSTNPSYNFKVVPYNADQLADLGTCATATITLPKRSVAKNDDPRHTMFDLGKIGTDDAQAQLDKGNLALDVTDLDVNSYGPDASLSRSYNSTNSAVGLFGPGWRFSFERNVSVDATGATYLDEDRDAHRFTLSGTAYLSPPGEYESLIATSASTPNGTASYELLHADKRSYELFSSTGALLREADQNGNPTDYKITSSEVDITAANGNKIVLTFSGGGHATATYSAGTVARQVAYTYTSSGANATDTAVYTFSDSATSTPTPGYTETDVFSSARLTRVTESQATTIANQPTNTTATWDIGYNASSALTTITAPYYNATQRGATTIGYGTDSGGLAKATVTQSGEVAGAVKNVYQDFGTNPSGTMAYKTNPYASGDTLAYWRYEYSPNEDELWEQSPDAAFKYWTYDSSGNVLTETDETGRVTTHAYDASNDEIQSVDPGGSVTSEAYDQYGDQTSVTKTLNTTGTACTLTQYDAYGRLALERKELYVDAGGTSHWATTASTYGSGDGFNDPTETDHYGETSTNGVTFTHENVDLGNGVGGGPSQLVEKSTFDALGDRLTSVDASSFTTNIVYDAAGRQLSSTDSLGLAGVSVFDGLGRTVGTYQQAGSSVIGYKTSAIDPFDRAISASTWRTSGATSTAVLDHTDTSAFDAMGNQQSATDSLVTGQPEIDQHDAAGDVTNDWTAGLSTTQTANAGFASRASFDGEEQETSQSDPGTMTAATTTTYTPDGNVAVVKAPDSTIATETYDAAGNNTTQTVSNGESIVSTFDAEGRATVTTDTGLATTYTYDLADRQTGAQASGRQLSTTTYNSQGWVLSTTDADGVTTTYIYDVYGRVVAQTVGTQGSQPKTTSSTYDAAGRLLSSTDPDGRVLSDSNDQFGRLTEQKQKASSGGTTLKDVGTSYDSLSRALSTSDTVSGMMTVWTYPTALGGTTNSAISVGGITTTTTVDSAGNELSRATSGSGFAAFTRSVTATDSAGRITAWTLGGTAGQRSFDGAGRETTQSGTGFSGTVTYTYDANGHKSGEYLPQSAPGGADSEGYSYDSNGRLTGATASGAATGSFSYDPAGDVATFTAPVNASGTTTSGVLEYDSNGRLTDRRVSGSVVTTYSFDSHGWRTAQGPTANPNSVVYSYTGQGGLKSYDTSSGVHATYTFDALGQRIGSVVTSGSVTTTTTYVYDGIVLRSLSATSTTSGTATVTWSITYAYDSDGHPYAGVYSANNASPTAFGMLTTDRGDVIGLTDTTGTAFAAYRYDAWGRALSVATQTVGTIKVADITARQPLRYAGYVYDSESGLYYLSARTYDPATMQWLQKDPAKADGEESGWQYCGDNPVESIDCSGLKLLPVLQAPQPQRKGNWCWAASAVSCIQCVTGKWIRLTAKMVGRAEYKRFLKAAKRDVNNPIRYAEDSFVWYVRKQSTSDHKGDLKNHGEGSAATAKGLKGYVSGVSVGQVKQDWTAITSQINHGWPVWVGLTWQGTKNGHALVFGGYEDGSTDNTKFVYVMDPAGDGDAPGTQITHGNTWEYVNSTNHGFTWTDTIWNIGK